MFFWLEFTFHLLVALNENKKMSHCDSQYSGPQIIIKGNIRKIEKLGNLR